MRKIVVAIMGTISGLVLLFSYHTSTNSEAAASSTNTDGGTTPQATTGTSTTTTAPSATSSASAAPTSTTSVSAGASGTYTGDAVSTRWGTVQVQITVRNGQITAAEAVQVPDQNPKDRQINSYAVPILNSEAVAAQSASIDAVSGATVTSGGYLKSLQSAIDAAQL